MKSLVRLLTPDLNRSLRSRMAGCNSPFSGERLVRPLTGRRLQRWTVSSRPNRSLGSRFVYDKNGRILSKTQTTTGSTNPAQKVSYTYNALGQLQNTITPSGQTISYGYGSGLDQYHGRVVAIQLNGVDVIKGALYLPFGPSGG